jgi:hypothetical protein
MVLMELVNFSEVKPVATEVVEAKSAPEVAEVKEAVVAKTVAKKTTKAKTLTTKKAPIKKVAAK